MENVVYKGIDKDFESYRNETIKKLDNDEYWKLIKHDGGYRYYKAIVPNTPLEFRIVITNEKMVSENGVFCSQCDKLMRLVESGEEWIGGLIPFKAKYNIYKCSCCDMRIKW